MTQQRGRMSMPAPRPGPHCKRFGPLLPLAFQESLLDDEAPETEALREHLADCAYCRAMLALYDTQEQALWRNFAERVIAAPSYTSAIIARIEEEPIVSQLPEQPTPEQTTDTLHTHNLDTSNIAQQRLEAARFALRPPKRRIHPLVAWLAPLAAVLLIALLAKVVFTAQRAGPAAPSPLQLAPNVRITIFAISMVSSDEGWAIAQRTVDNTAPDATGANAPLTYLLLHDHNGIWTAITSPFSARPEAISMVSSSDGWLVGNDGLIAHYDGHSWSKVQSPTAQPLSSIKMVSATDGWASGVTESPNDPALILHYNGNSWQLQSNLILPQISYTSDLQPQPDGEVWALAEMSSDINPPVADSGTAAPIDASALLYYDGHQWHEQDTVPNVSFHDLEMISSQEGWMLGDGTTANGVGGSSFLFHYTHGHLMSQPVQQLIQQIAGIPADSTDILTSLAMASPSDGWIIGYANYFDLAASGERSQMIVLRYSSGRWIPTTLPIPPNPHGWIIEKISIQPDGSIWAVGEISKTITQQGKTPFIAWGPLALSYSGGAWSVVLN